MVELAKFTLRNIPSLISRKAPPIHVAINTGSVKGWCEEKKKDVAEGVKQHFSQLDSMLDFQLKNQYRVMSINLVDTSQELVNGTKDFLRRLMEDERIHKNQVRIFFIGQWYELDSELVDLLKEAMEKTKQYDNFFLNFCISYDGQEEILGAVRLVVRKITAGKMKEEDMTLESIKENIYTSYFPPPQLIIETDCQYSGMLLWDSKGSSIYYTQKPWMLFDRKEFEEAISFYEKTNSKQE